jgi:hypothetical protein
MTAMNARTRACLVLAAICSSVVDARLLGSTRSPTLLDAELPDIPVVQFLLHQKANRSRVGAWALKGTPTHYESSGCRKVTEVYDEVKNPFGASMSIARCFTFCSKRKDIRYFGITSGTRCSCGKVFVGAEVDDSSCDMPCPGNAKDKCGGIEGTSLYVMFDCTDATKEEIEAEKKEKKEALLKSYGEFEGETCGQAKDNHLKLDDKGYLTGSADYCKIACWKGKRAEECHGFTYDALTSKCTFHYDVTAGPVTKNPKAACYFKMP